LLILSLSSCLAGSDTQVLSHLHVERTSGKLGAGGVAVEATTTYSRNGRRERNVLPLNQQGIKQLLAVIVLYPNRRFAF
jgi:hypothetical protein